MEDKDLARIWRYLFTHTGNTYQARKMYNWVIRELKKQRTSITNEIALTRRTPEEVARIREIFEGLNGGSRDLVTS